MNTFKSMVLTAMLSVVVWSVQAQTVDEIIDKYLENTGGKAKWAAIKSVKMTGKAKMQGMEIPITVMQESDGKQKIGFNFQGKDLTQMAFDGTTAWSTNFQTMKAEKMEAEDTDNLKVNSATDFPDPFYNYKEKGYKAELEGKETIEGTECFKVKLTKKPVKVEGKSEDEITYYFFDKDNFVPIMSRTTVKKGQGKGATVETMVSDYQDTPAGVMMPFTMTIKYNGQVGQSLVMEKVETNLTIDPKEYAMPEQK